MKTCKAGFQRGKRRFRCRDCNRFFLEDPPIPARTKDDRPRKKHGLPSASHLILELHAISQNVLGRTPTTKDIIELSKKGRSHSLATYYAVFGSFVTAIRRARLKQHYMQQFDDRGKERLLAEIRNLSKVLKRPLLGKDVAAARKKGLVSPINHFQIAFGTIPKAIAAAGVAPKVSYTREEMIRILRDLDAKLPRPVQGPDIKRLLHEGKSPAKNAFIKEFGSLRKARLAAGVKNSYKKANVRTIYWQKYTENELLEQLKELGKKLGRKPTDREINQASRKGKCAASTTFANKFGSLNQAYLKAGFTELSKNHNRYTNDQLVKALERLSKELGRFPGFHDIKRACREGRCPSNNALRRLGTLTSLRNKYEHLWFSSKHKSPS